MRSEYTVQTINNCKIFFGGVPIGDLTGIVSAQPEGAVLDNHAARHLGATMVIGLPDDCKSLLALPACYELQAEVNLAAQHGLSEAARKWLMDGERGTSSNTIFRTLAGIKPEPEDWSSHPHDPADLRRCRLLLEQVPEFAPRIVEMAAVSPQWAGLVKFWELLCRTMDDECDWRNGKGHAANTYEIMQEILE